MSAKEYNDSMGQSRKDFDAAIDQEKQKRVMRGHASDKRFDKESKPTHEPDTVKVVRPSESFTSKHKGYLGHMAKAENINKGHNNTPIAIVDPRGSMGGMAGGMMGRLPGRTIAPARPGSQGSMGMRLRGPRGPG